MESTGPVALQEAPIYDTPIYDGVIIDRGWSPADLRAPLELDAMIAGSYSTVIVNAAVARSSLGVIMATPPPSALS